MRCLNPVTADKHVEVIKFVNDGGQTARLLVQIKRKTLVTLNFERTGQTHHANVMQSTNLTSVLDPFREKTI